MYLQLLNSLFSSFLFLLSPLSLSLFEPVNPLQQSQSLSTTVTTTSVSDTTLPLLLSHCSPSPINIETLTLIVVTSLCLSTTLTLTWPATMETQHLNRAQKRAQAIKTELQQLDSDHLNTFIDGVGDIEPPKYRRVGAKIVPDLAMVDLKQGVETYNIGNVYFQEADELRNVNFRIDLATKTFKIDRRDRLPKDQGSLAIPILQSVAQEFIPLWKVKYQRIIEQKDIINEIRRLARNVFNQPPRLSVNGKVNHHKKSSYLLVTTGAMICMATTLQRTSLINYRV